MNSNVKYRQPSYHEEVMELYETAIMQHRSEHAARNHYHFVCQYLRKMREMGGAEKVRPWLLNCG